MSVKIFLSDYKWTLRRNVHGSRHHVTALYKEVFRDSAVCFLPRYPSSGLLWSGLRHIITVLRGSPINVLTPGYPIVAGALAIELHRDLKLVIHTWKVPGRSSKRIASRLYDLLLRRVIDRARIVIVASHIQKRQLEEGGVRCPVIFSPVTVDSEYWYPNPTENDAVLAEFGLLRHAYVLTVGGNDRDELYGARLARQLNLTYVRASNHPKAIRHALSSLSTNNLKADARVLASPTDAQLRVLYGASRVVCLPTITETNPAGLSALVEAMACGAIVAIPSDLSEGYLEDGISGLFLSRDPADFAMRLLTFDGEVLRANARRVAKTVLDVESAADSLREAIFSSLR